MLSMHIHKYHFLWCITSIPFRPHE